MHALYVSGLRPPALARALSLPLPLPLLRHAGGSRSQLHEQSHRR